MNNQLYYVSRNHVRSAHQAPLALVYLFLDFFGVDRYSAEWNLALKGTAFISKNYGLMQFIPESHAAPKTNWSSYGQQVN